MRPESLLALALVAACASRPPLGFAPEDAPDVPADVEADGPPAPDGSLTPDVAPVVRDAAAVDVALAPDAACTVASVAASVERLPVDIVWLVDNSVSMAPAIDQVIAGLNRFATLVGTRGLDYRVVLLSLRNAERRVTVGGAARYALCIPRPLAGDDRCGNGERFLHSSVDVRSTQPLEQLLGTLGQTRGYAAGEQRGGEPWRHFLRAGATKTVIVVTDDNSRLSPDDFERFRGGANPNNGGLLLPPGLLDPSWAGLFQAYTFGGIYGWGSDSEPGVRCTYPDRTQPPSSGPAYTTLVGRTGGVRARLCDGAAAWGPFFEDVATAVVRASRVACEVAIPPAPEGMALDPGRINVAVAGASGRAIVGRVAGAGACGERGGWHYDDERRPTRVLLCPASCARAQEELRAGSARVEVLFGCQSVPG